MKPKQIERIQSKIKQIRSALIEEKRIYGANDDNRGLIYLPLEYYIKIQDYKGGINYPRWFQKNFTDDIGFPEFLFDRPIIKIDKREWSHWESPEQAEDFQYTCNDKNLLDFSEWLEQLENTERFKKLLRMKIQQKSVDTWLEKLIN
jgi:hypothetical protein